MKKQHWSGGTSPHRPEREVGSIRCRRTRHGGRDRYDGHGVKRYHGAGAYLCAWATDGHGKFSRSLLGVDLIEAAAIGKVRLVRLGPAAKGLVDGHQRELGELLLKLGLGLFAGRTVEILACNLLALVGIQMLQIFLGQRATALLVHHLVDHGHRRLGQDGQRRRNDLELVRAELLERQEGLVFPGQQYVAHTTLHKGDGGAARACVQHRHVLVQIAHEFLGLVVAAVLALGEFPRGQIVPARAARSLGVGRDHLHTGLDQVIPVLDALGVALLYQEHDGRAVGSRVVRQALLPIGLDETVLDQRVDVAAQRQRGHVGINTVDDGARLLARAAMRLLELHVLAGLALPVLGERLVVLHVQLTRRVIGNVQKADGIGRQRGHCGKGHRPNKCEREWKLDKVAAIFLHGVLSGLRCFELFRHEPLFDVDAMDSESYATKLEQLRFQFYIQKSSKEG
ncbi:hypothetical protein SDC9_100860 [bioreactor metagenome]|uniref:Uncharacterized protein n=1 Tax=bioreactor metagenome TaxID=1076179 RepID=A0A645AM14_9ZZZZ